MQVFWGIADAVLGLSICCGVAIFLLYEDLPDGDLEHERIIAQTTQIYDSSGQHLLYEIHGEENRRVISHGDIPDTMRMATIAAEDDSFYRHWGIDLGSIFRAARANLENNSMVQGGSTITQQLARSAYLTREKTYERKIKEMLLAIKIERRYSKDQILDYYLNEVPYGSNAYGIESAAQIFFGKNAKDITLDEAALIAALPKAPSRLSPYGGHSAELKNRQQYILTRIGDLGLASVENVALAKKTDTFAALKPFRENIDAPHFVFYVKEQLEKIYGVQEIEKGGLKVVTTLDYDMQKKAQEIITNGAFSNEKKFRGSNAALVAIDPRTGAILAMVGSRDFFDSSIDGQVNVALSPRQPGSSFKPIIYGNAFERGYQPETILFDVPTDFGPDGSGRAYIPRNYDGKFHGMLSMRQTLAMSLNVPAVQTLYLGGLDNTLAYAKKLGINTLNDRDRYGLSLALGGGEVKLLELTGAFSVYANDGKRNTPAAILSINDARGNEVYKHIGENDQVINPEIARKIDSILTDNAARTPIFGPRSPLVMEGKTLAAKTGTTQEFKDAWTVGFTPSLAVGVWTGNNNSAPMKAGSDGVFVAAPLWNSFMRYALMDKGNEKFADYQRVSSNIAMLSGKLGTETAFFKKGSDKKLSEKKLAKTDPEKVEMRPVGEVHSILYYTPKENPLSGLAPDLSDPMLARWEKSLQTANVPINPEVAGVSTVK
jgi:1A family penicillin-binding protein